MSHSKRSRSPSVTEQQSKKLRTENSSANLLSDLSNVLNTIKSTPPSGEISAEVMETFKILLLEIEKRSSDENNLEAKQMKHQSDRCLETWFDELLALCDGELDLDEFELTEEEEDSIALALELQEEQDEEDEEIDIEIVDDGSDVGSQVQLTVS